LANGTIYLAHGHDELTRPIGLRLQKRLEEQGITVENPFHGREQELYDRYAAQGKPYPLEVCEEIVNKDLDQIDNSDGVLAVPSRTSIGTFMEIFYASYLYEKPVWTLWLHEPKQGAENRHPWLEHFTKLYVGAEFEDSVIANIVDYFSNPNRRVV